MKIKYLGLAALLLYTCTTANMASAFDVATFTNLTVQLQALLGQLKVQVEQKQGLAAILTTSVRHCDVNLVTWINGKEVRVTRTLYGSATDRFAIGLQLGSQLPFTEQIHTANGAGVGYFTPSDYATNKSYLDSLTGNNRYSIMSAALADTNSITSGHTFPSITHPYVEARVLNTGILSWPTATVAILAEVTNCTAPVVVPPVINIAATGYFDVVTPNSCSVAGWAYDPDNQNTAISVDVYRDQPAGQGGTFVTRCTADGARSDVNSTMHITGNHGFNCELPLAYKGTGEHALYIHAIDISGAPNQLLKTNGKKMSCGAVIPPQPTSSTTPNIIFVLSDDLDFAAMSQFPKLKRLMTDQGMTFQNHFVSLSLCCPSRAATLCGEYAHNNGVFTNSATNSDGTNGAYTAFQKFNDDSKTMALWLKNAGYATALMGKYLNGYDLSEGVPYTTIPAGWTDWAVPLEGNAYGQYNYTLNANGKPEPHYLADCNHGQASSSCKMNLADASFADKQANFMMNVIENKAIDFITKNATTKKPFFLYMAPYTPHSPSTPAPKYESLLTDTTWLAAHPMPRPASFNEADMTDKPLWAQQAALLGNNNIAVLEKDYHKRIISMYAVEDMLGDLIDTLTKTGQLNNTYIVFTSDNGFHLGEHRLEAGKLTEFDTDLHVPLIVRGPGIKAGSLQNALTANVDIAPTFENLAGLPIPLTVDGRSFTPLLLGQNIPYRQALLIEHADPADTKLLGPTGEPRDTETQTEKIKGGELVGQYFGVRTLRYTFVHYVRTGEDELYDNFIDPQQLTNIASTANAALVNKLRAWSMDLSTCKGASCRYIDGQQRLLGI